MAFEQREQAIHIGGAACSVGPLSSFGKRLWQNFFYSASCRARARGRRNALTKASVNRPAVFSRAQWGADERRVRDTPTYMSTIKGAVLHHTAGRWLVRRTRRDPRRRARACAHGSRHRAPCPWRRQPGIGDRSQTGQRRRSGEAWPDYSEHRVVRTQGAAKSNSTGGRPHAAGVG